MKKVYIVEKYEMETAFEPQEIKKFDSKEAAVEFAAKQDVKPYYYGASSYIMVPVVDVQCYEEDEDGEIDYDYTVTSYGARYDEVKKLVDEKRGEKMRSEAQKAADKRYREKTKGNYVQWNICLKHEEAAKIDAMISETDISRSDFLRWATPKYEAELNQNKKTLEKIKKTDMYDYLTTYICWTDADILRELDNGDKLIAVNQEGVEIYSYYDGTHENPYDVDDDIYLEYHVDENNEEWILDENGQYEKK